VIVNELAQWAVLLFIAVFVFGLTRQLGNFIVPRREQAAVDIGPDLGKKLPPDLFTPAERARVRELCERKTTDWAVVLVVSEDCAGCVNVLERVKVTGIPQGAPIVVLSRTSLSGSAYTASLREIADMVVADGDRIKAAGLTLTPFAMIVSASLTVLHKRIPQDLWDVVAAWRAEDGHAHRPDDRGAPDGAQTMLTIQADGRRS
jgi:hypothetical protein